MSDIIKYHITCDGFYDTQNFLIICNGKANIQSQITIWEQSWSTKQQDQLHIWITLEAQEVDGLMKA